MPRRPDLWALRVVLVQGRVGGHADQLRNMLRPQAERQVIGPGVAAPGFAQGQQSVKRCSIGWIRHLLVSYRSTERQCAGGISFWLWQVSRGQPAILLRR